VPEEEIQTAAEVFVGYLLLDAWIGNTDRHHGNWGVLAVKLTAPPNFSLSLAPTFDHASSLGRNESEERRKERLTTKDSRFTVKAYAERASSAIYLSETDPRPLTALAAFREAYRQYPRAGRAWARKLGEVQASEIRGILERVPRDRISEPAVEFALAILDATKKAILEYAEGDR
jgi:hypothetical protein